MCMCSICFSPRIDGPSTITFESGTIVTGMDFFPNKEQVQFIIDPMRQMEFHVENSLL